MTAPIGKRERQTLIGKHREFALKSPKDHPSSLPSSLEGSAVETTSTHATVAKKNKTKPISSRKRIFDRGAEAKESLEKAVSSFLGTFSNKSSSASPFERQLKNAYFNIAHGDYFGAVILCLDMHKQGASVDFLRPTLNAARRHLNPQEMAGLEKALPSEMYAVIDPSSVKQTATSSAEKPAEPEITPELNETLEQLQSASRTTAASLYSRSVEAASPIGQAIVSFFGSLWSSKIQPETPFENDLSAAYSDIRNQKYFAAATLCHQMYENGATIDFLRPTLNAIRGKLTPDELEALADTLPSEVYEAINPTVAEEEDIEETETTENTGPSLLERGVESTKSFGRTLTHFVSNLWRKEPTAPFAQRLRDAYEYIKYGDSFEAVVLCSDMHQQGASVDFLRPTLVAARKGLKPEELQSLKERLPADLYAVIDPTVTRISTNEEFFASKIADARSDIQYDEPVSAILKCYAMHRDKAPIDLLRPILADARKLMDFNEPQLQMLQKMLPSDFFREVIPFWSTLQDAKENIKFNEPFNAAIQCKGALEAGAPLALLEPILADAGRLFDLSKPDANLAGLQAALPKVLLTAMFPYLDNIESAREDTRYDDPFGAIIKCNDAFKQGASIALLRDILGTAKTQLATTNSAHLASLETFVAPEIWNLIKE